MPFSPLLKYPNTIILFLICISTSSPTHSTASELAIGNGGGQFLALQQAIETALKNHPIVQEATAGVIAQEALNLAKQRYKLGLGSVVEVTQSEVAVTLAQTRLAEALYDYKIAEVTLAYATTGHSELELDPIIR